MSRENTIISTRNRPSGKSPAQGDKRLRKFYLFLIVVSTIVSLAVYIGVHRGHTTQLKVMDQVCGFFCFPHDIFYPPVKHYFHLPDTPALFSIPLWSVVSGFVIIALYFSLLFLPLYLFSRSVCPYRRRFWAVLQIVMLAAHLVFYLRITFPVI